MAANYGVNFNISNGAASPIKVQSDTPIGIAASLKGASKEMIYTKGQVMKAWKLCQSLPFQM